MNKVDYYKEEMIKRYCYLKDNSIFIFSIFMRDDLSDKINEYKELSRNVSTLEEYNYIDLKLIDSFSLYMLESLIFEDKTMEETSGYKYFEILRTDPLNINKSKKGLELKDTFNNEFFNDLLYFDTFELLSRIYENVARQSNDFVNKENKLKIIDEYIRIAKYSNNGIKWRGGYYLDNIDRNFNPVNFRYYTEGKDLSLSRLGYDVGVESNTLIETTKDISLTNEDKKKIYFKYNNEIPFDLKIRCKSNGVSEIDRPQYSKPCDKEFILDVRSIYSIEHEDSYAFLTLCPSCLYIVGINAGLIPESIQEEIVWNNKKDPLISKEYFLKSEIHSLTKSKLR